MATYNSTQLAQLAANASDFLRPAEANGRVRIASFDYTVPVGGVAVNETVALCNVPAGATVIGGVFAHNDVGNGISFGDADSADRYSSTISMASASTASVEFANTIAKDTGVRRSSEFVLTAKAIGGGWTAAKVFRGAIFYCVD